MTLQQEVTAKIAFLPDTSVQLVIALVDEMLKQARINVKPEAEVKTGSKLDAFNAIMEFKRSNHTPADIDIDAISKEAMEKKYGYFD